MRHSTQNSNRNRGSVANNQLLSRPSNRVSQQQRSSRQTEVFNQSNVGSREQMANKVEQQDKDLKSDYVRDSRSL